MSPTLALTGVSHDFIIAEAERGPIERTETEVCFVWTPSDSRQPENPHEGRPNRPIGRARQRAQRKAETIRVNVRREGAGPWPGRWSRSRA